MIPQTPIQTKLFQEFASYDKFIEHFKPANLIILYEDINTVEESIAQQRISIEDIKILYTTNKFHAGIDYLSRWIDYLQEFLNINNRLTKVRDVATVLYKDHRHFYLSDLAIIFHGILRSEYGRFYGSVDSQTITTSFASYNVSRYAASMRAERVISQVIDRKMEDIKAELRRKIYEEVVDEGLNKSVRFAEVEKRLAQRLPDILRTEREKLMKEAPKQISSQE